MTSNTPGFTSLITADALAKAQAGELQLPLWEEFQQQLMGGSVKFPSQRHPFLFAGEPTVGGVFELLAAAAAAADGRQLEVPFAVAPLPFCG